MDNSALEQYYESVILPQYSKVITFKKISWKDHGKVGLDTWAHYFENEVGREFVLVYEDFPGDEYLSDSLTHDIVTINDAKNIQIMLSTQKQIENLVGYFTLYQERNS